MASKASGKAEVHVMACNLNLLSKDQIRETTEEVFQNSLQSTFLAKLS